MELECGADVLYEGSDNISIYESSQWAERGFCRQCGTHLFYRLKATQTHSIPVGLFDPSCFDDGEDLLFKSQIFIDQKPDYYSFENKTENMTTAEVFAKYAPPESS